MATYRISAAIKPTLAEIKGLRDELVAMGRAGRLTDACDSIAVAVARTGGASASVTADDAYAASTGYEPDSDT